MRQLILIALTFALSASPPHPAWAQRDSAERDSDSRDEAKRRLGIISAPSETTLSRPDVSLGRSLFWDTRISSDQMTACASCHSAEDWGADRRRFSPDARGKNTARNSQTVFNATLQPSLRWTGDRRSAAHQAERSITGSMGFAAAEDIIPVLRRHGYEPAFREAFPDDPDPVSPTHYARGIAAYEATLITPAPLDRYLAGDDDAIGELQKEGLNRFLDLGCADCHNGPLLGGESLERFGLFKDYWDATKSEKIDAGLFETTKNESDRYRFRVPMLRNIAKTAPYFHDGSVDNLPDAVRVMADVQLDTRLDDHEVEGIVAFLESLTGEVPGHYAPPSEK